ncbi:MAG TPA: YbhB/YbcL family Raf kinase inhibitor-like protein, partial [Candidatus Thermoplasmatota archaeon]|nr:YbhB/YbcL family Raf kinase inhibitor-like protein [Candidatus Thermoplasmatota archaeon]
EGFRAAAAGGVEGGTSAKSVGWHGPCPPPGKVHRYFFRVYALDTKLGLPPGAERAALDRALRGHVLAQGELMGTFRR